MVAVAPLLELTEQETRSKTIMGEIVHFVRPRLAKLSADQRLEVLEDAIAGYCQYCGCNLEDKGGFCCCANDD